MEGILGRIGKTARDVADKAKDAINKARADCSLVGINVNVDNKVPDPANWYIELSNVKGDRWVIESNLKLEVAIGKARQFKDFSELPLTVLEAESK